MLKPYVNQVVYLIILIRKQPRNGLHPLPMFIRWCCLRSIPQMSTCQLAGHVPYYGKAHRNPTVDNEFQSLHHAQHFETAGKPVYTVPGAYGSHRP